MKSRPIVWIKFYFVGLVGMGVQFERMSSNHQRTIDGFVDDHT